MSHLDSENPSRTSDSGCQLVVVQDYLQTCPYRDDATARMPLRLPIGTVTEDVVDDLLGLGYRRSGEFVYRTQCPACNECKPTRVPVAEFKMTSSFRRVLNRGDRELTHQWGPPVLDRYRVDMFNQHRSLRGLGAGELADVDQYRGFLVDTCCDTRELAIYKDSDLVAISIVDVGRNSTSAVYTHFLPDFSRYSLGTYAVLKQIQFAKETEREFVYLGMYVADNSHLNYKARYRPQQRLLDGEWQNIDDAPK